MGHQPQRPRSTEGASRRELDGVRAEKSIATAGTVFLFPGQVPTSMQGAADLVNSVPAFASQMSRCDAAFAEFVDWSVLEVVRGSPESPSLDRPDVAAAVLFAVTVSHAALLRVLGICPDAVLGYSQGEIAAAYIAGAMSLRDAAEVITLYGSVIGAVTGSGDDADALRDTLRKSLAGLRPQTGDIPFISSVTGAGLDPSILDGDYWYANLRQPVLFREAVRWSYERGYRTYIESSPHPALIAEVQGTLADYADGVQSGPAELVAHLR